MSMMQTTQVFNHFSIEIVEVEIGYDSCCFLFVNCDRYETFIFFGIFLWSSLMNVWKCELKMMKIIKAEDEEGKEKN